jgi:hypothetical protein
MNMALITSLDPGMSGAGSESGVTCGAVAGKGGNSPSISLRAGICHYEGCAPLWCGGSSWGAGRLWAGELAGSL